MTSKTRRTSVGGETTEESDSGGNSGRLNNGETKKPKPRNNLRTKFVSSFYKYLRMFLLFHVIGCLAKELPVANGIFAKSRKTALLEGDILLGALVSVHHQPMQKTASLLECGEIREQYGIQRVEAAFLAIDRINSDKKLLPNITLGIEIRDSCWYSSIALEQSIEFIRDAITGPDGGNSTRQSPCPRSLSPANKNLVGVVGPGSSAVTIQVQNLLQLFGIPQVGYSATSRDLSDKSRFSYFLRVVPSDYYQAQVMVDIVQHYNWTYVSAVHTDGNYGQSGMTAFRELAETNDICIAKEDSVLSNAENEAFDEVIRQLAEDDRANVVVCFCEGMTVRNLLKAAIRLHQVHRFLFLGSDGWADRSDVVAGLEDAAVGGLSVKIQSSYVTGFDEYYFKLHPATNHRNPWFKEFWEYRFNCSFSANETQAANNTDAIKHCTGEEKLSEGYKQDTKMSFVVKAIYTMAYGLHNLHKDFCRGKVGLCKGILPINGSLFRDYLMNVTFSYLNETVSFDSRGDPPGRYAIMNFQRLANGSFDYVKVGSWDNGTLTMDESLVVFNGSDKNPPLSICAAPCAPGQVKSFVDTGDHTQICCWICNDCEEDEYLESETKCSQCGKDHWPNSSKTGCDPIPVEYLDWNYDESIAALTIACMGFLATCFTMAVFIRFNNTPIVKASTRELTYIIFMGMMVSYLSSLPLLHAPSTTTCAFSRVMPGLSFSMIYAALVTKTNRIARILAGNKKIMIRKLKFLSATSQVVITLILISIEACIIIFMLFYQPPEAVKSYPKSGKVVMICNTTPLGVIAPMGFDFFLIGLCTLYAIKTRNLPENFNEAKFIGFSMYTTCVIWLAWVPIYFGSNHKIISLSVCTSLSAFVTLVLLFFPKIYIILCRPLKNDRSAFTTATNVRCHIGSTIKQQKPVEKTKSALVESPSCTSYISGDSKWSGLLSRVRGVVQQGGASRVPHSQLAFRESNPKNILKRETSVWSDVSQSSVIQHRDYLLNKAYGSQLDLADIEPGSRWSHAEKGCQTCDELLDPLIPRMRRRVVRAVREGTLSAAEGREFFSLTHGWMQAQAEAARIEYQKMKDVEAVKLAEQRESELMENCEELAKAAMKKRSWEQVRMEMDKTKHGGQTKPDGRSLMSRFLGKNSKQSLLQVVEITESDDNSSAASDILKSSSYNSDGPEVVAGALANAVNSEDKNSTVLIEGNANLDSEVIDAILSSAHLGLDPASALGEISNFPYQPLDSECPETASLLDSISHMPLEMANPPQLSNNQVESPFISVKPSYFFVVEDGCENAGPNSTIQKLGDEIIVFRESVNQKFDAKPAVVSDSDHSSDNYELELKFFPESRKDCLDSCGAHLQDAKKFKNEINEAKENELIILGLLRQRSLLYNEKNSGRSRNQNDVRSLIDPNGIPEMNSLNHTKSNHQNSLNLQNPFLEKNGLKFSDYSYSKIDDHITNSIDIPDPLRSLSGDLAKDNIIFEDNEESSELLNTSAYIQNAEKILSDYKLAVMSSFPKDSGDSLDSRTASDPQNGKGTLKTVGNAMPLKGPLKDNDAKTKDSDQVPQFQGSASVPPSKTQPIGRYSSMAHSPSPLDKKCYWNPSQKHSSLLQKMSKYDQLRNQPESLDEHVQNLIKQSVEKEYDADSCQVSFESDNDYEKCSKLDSSECETDDSSNIEDFFRVRGMNFARTSRKAKKL